MLISRRIADDFREMRWGAVLVDLVLLILGIVIGLAVNNWMEERRDARVERQYLEFLARDLDADLRGLAEFEAFSEAETRDGIAAYRALAGGPSVADKESVSQALSRLTAIRPLRLTRTAYSDLISSGNIRLISNPLLRDRIISLYESNARLQRVLEVNSDQFVMGMYISYLSDKGLVIPRLSANFPLLRSLLHDFGATMGTPAADAREDRLWRLAPDAPEWDALRVKVWRRTFVSFIDVRLARSAAEQIAALRQALANELVRRWPDARLAPATASPDALPNSPATSQAPSGP